MPRGPSRPYPVLSVTETAKLADTIRNNNAGRPMNRILLAQPLNRKPGSSDFRDLIAVSAKYGFTEGNFHSETIELTELGEQLTKPRSESERLDALRKGMRNIPFFETLLQHYNNNRLPTGEFLKNALEREPFNVPAEWSEEGANVFIDNGKALGFIRDVGGAPYVILEAGPPAEPLVASLPKIEQSSQLPTEELQEKAAAEKPPLPPVEERPSPSQLQFFIAHGHDKEALQQLQRILGELGIPYVVAVEEANAGRPISQKVKDLIDACSAGIFIFSADEEFSDKQGNPVFRPRENVIYELGAASYRYGRRIVVFKEKGVAFPSDFRDLGYIEFEKGQLAGKTMDLLKELIALKAVRLLPGS